MSKSNMKNTATTGLASIVMVSLAMYLGVMGKPTEMGLIIAACSISIAFLNLDRIQKFKGAGFEAEMRQAVEEAHATVEQLRILAATSTESTLTTLMSGSFFDGTTLDHRLSMHDKLVECLQHLGVSQKQISEARHMWNKGVGVIYHRAIRHALADRKEKNIVNPDATPERTAAATEFQELLKFERWDAPSSQEMRAFIQVNGLLTEQISELLSDYAYFEQTGQIKRREVFIML
jgi:hypothetical protein